MTLRIEHTLRPRSGVPAWSTTPLAPATQGHSHRGNLLPSETAGEPCLWVQQEPKFLPPWPGPRHPQAARPDRGVEGELGVPSSLPLEPGW